MRGKFLDKILANKRDKVARLRGGANLSSLKNSAFQTRRNAAGHKLRTALNRKERTNIIAEIKRASPSKGVINDSVDVIELAQIYRAGGASAISVLTEEDFFRGSLNDLAGVRGAVDLPILRKDFFVDELQVYESAVAGADAILLIVAALEEADLNKMLRLAQDDLGMDAVVEVHTIDELIIAESVGADIIGVNNRDLHSFEVSLDVSRSLIGHRPTGALMIAESGISTREEIEELKNLGFVGFLIGEALMRTGNASELLGGWV
jgi:indole-3-glycerol phosphate synthase